MSNTTCRFLIRMCTLLGLLCIRIKSNSFKTSHSIALLDVLSLSVGFIFLVFIHLSPAHIRKLLFSFDPISSNTLSSLTKAIFRIGTMSVQVAAVVISLLQYFKRNEILLIMTYMSEVVLTEKSSKKFEKATKKNFVIMLALCVIMTVIQVLGVFRPSLIAYSAALILAFPYLYSSTFLNFLNTFEHFFVIQLQDFRNELNEFSKNSAESHFPYSKFARRFRSIAKSNEDFNKAIGLQISVMACYIMLQTILMV